MTQIAATDSTIVFQPYVGTRYHDQAAAAPKILLLGESHYYKDDLQDHRQLTNHVVQEYLDGQKFKFFTIATKICAGEDLGVQKKQALWEHISFYNYIQESVGENPRDRPTKAMWGNSLPAFKEVLNQLGSSLNSL
jgi:hypothetical protein